MTGGYVMTHSTKTWLALLGKRIDDPEVTAALAELSAVPARELEVDHGLIDVCAPDRGLEITFKPASKLRDGATLGVSADELVLAVIFFYSEGYEDNQAYSGTLPRGLRFEQSRSAVHALLGAPAGTSSVHKNDRWDTDQQYTTVDFSDDEQRILLVTVGLHWKPRARAAVAEPTA